MYKKSSESSIFYPVWSFLWKYMYVCTILCLLTLISCVQVLWGAGAKKSAIEEGPPDHRLYICSLLTPLDKERHFY